MSQNRPKTDDQQTPDFYLPATPPTAETLGRFGNALASLFRRRGHIQADRRHQQAKK